MIFVFGSNLAGRHGKGASLFARKYYGAMYGVGIGRTGDAYAIPTKDEKLIVLPISVITQYVDTFICYAKDHSELEFMVTRVGCGLAGYKDKEIAPLFALASSNCLFPSEWLDILVAYKNDITIHHTL